MARTNKCKVCGWTGEPDGQRRWLGVNHNLCSACVTKCDRCGGGGTPPSKPREPMPTMGMMSIAAMVAAVSVAPHRRKR